MSTLPKRRPLSFQLTTGIVLTLRPFIHRPTLPSSRLWLLEEPHHTLPRSPFLLLRHRPTSITHRYHPYTSQLLHSRDQSPLRPMFQHITESDVYPGTGHLPPLHINLMEPLGCDHHLCANELAPLNHAHIKHQLPTTIPISPLPRRVVRTVHMRPQQQKPFTRF